MQSPVEYLSASIWEPKLHLPESVQEIAEVIGWDDALYLIGQLPTLKPKPGKRPNPRVSLYIPKRLKPNHNLIRILGEEQAQKLVAEFGGLIMYPANCNQFPRNSRNREIRRMAVDGMTPREIAEIVGITARQVRNIIRDAPPV